MGAWGSKEIPIQAIGEGELMVSSGGSSPTVLFLGVQAGCERA